VASYRDVLGFGFQGYWNPETRTADQTWTAGSPAREPWGARTLTVTDPDGYRWRLLEQR
jgi:hypothetical protein